MEPRASQGRARESGEVVEHYKHDAAPGAQTSSPHQQEILTEFYARALGGSPAPVALDFGCGRGANLRQLVTVAERVVAADVSSAALDAAKENMGDAAGAVEFKLLDGGRLPFEDATFPLTLCTEVLEHVEDFRYTASELERVTAPGGHLVISTPNYRNVMGLIKRYRDWRSGRHDYDPWHAHAGGFERLVTAPQIRGAFSRSELLEARGADYAFALGIVWPPARRRLSRYLLLAPGRSPRLAPFGMQYYMLLRRR